MNCKFSLYEYLIDIIGDSLYFKQGGRDELVGDMCNMSPYLIKWLSLIIEGSFKSDNIFKRIDDSIFYIYLDNIIDEFSHQFFIQINNYIDL